MAYKLTRGEKIATTTILVGVPLVALVAGYGLGKHFTRKAMANQVPQGLSAAQVQAANDGLADLHTTCTQWAQTPRTERLRAVRMWAQTPSSGVDSSRWDTDTVRIYNAINLLCDPSAPLLAIGSVPTDVPALAPSAPAGRLPAGKPAGCARCVGA